MNQVELLDKSAVIGAGLMGTQIGVVLAKASRIVYLMSRHQRTLQRAERDSRSYLEQLSRHGLLRGSNPETLMKRIRTTPKPSLVRNGKAESLVRLCGYAMREWQNEKNTVDDRSKD